MRADLKALIGKLNPTCRSAIEAAAGLCLKQTHFDVEVEHLFIKLVEVNDADVQFVLRHYDVDTKRVSQRLTDALGHLKMGNSRMPAIAPSLVDLLCDAWLIGSLNYADNAIRSAYVLLAYLTDARSATSEVRRELVKIPSEDLATHLKSIVGKSAETGTESVGLTLQPMDRRIFLSYRRDDSSGYARAISRELIDAFGKDGLFLDVDASEPGADFVEELDKALTRCAVVVVLIGKRWSAPQPIADERGRMPRDFVRLELSRALSRKVRVLPVLLEGAMMPAEEELPEELKGLATRNALAIDHITFHEDTRRLVTALRRIIADSTQKA